MSKKSPCPQVAHRLIFKTVGMGSILSVYIQHSEDIHILSFGTEIKCKVFMESVISELNLEK